MLVSAPGQVAAQSASAEALLEEVVVTARRREESLQDLPLSVAAISSDAMQAQGIYDIKDIQDFVPNVAFREQDRRGRGSIFIRGIGSGGPGSFRPVGAGLYLDGHYMPGNNSKVMSTLDMERVEVLRGPQGTLFGKNTTGGAIQFISAKPQQEFDADILLRAADYGETDFQPFGDSTWLDGTLAFRYHINPRWEVGLEYRYLDRSLDTSALTNDATVNMILLAFAYTF